MGKESSTQCSDMLCLSFSSSIAHRALTWKSTGRICCVVQMLERLASRAAHAKTARPPRPVPFPTADCHVRSLALRPAWWTMNQPLQNCCQSKLLLLELENGVPSGQEVSLLPSVLNQKGSHLGIRKLRQPPPLPPAVPSSLSLAGYSAGARVGASRLPHLACSCTKSNGNY